MRIHPRDTWKVVTLVAVLVASILPKMVRAAEPRIDSKDHRNIPEISWTTSLEHFQFDADKFVGQRLTLKCPPLPSHRDFADLHGTDAFPSSAPICLAALHSGAISPKGGIFTLQLNPGLEKYHGSQKHGVTSLGLPKTERSIMILTEENLDQANELQLRNIPRLDWDTRFTQTGLANRKLIGQRFRFRLAPMPKDRRARLIFGTDVYAFSSPIGWAALHSGILDGQETNSEHATVTIQLNPAVKTLLGSHSNGVTSRGKRGGDSRTLLFVKS